MLEAGLLVPGTFVYYDDYSLEHCDWDARAHPHVEERLAHQEVTEEWQLAWRQLPSFVYRGPVANLSWVRQWPEGYPRAPVGKLLSKRDLVPVLQLMSCGRCNQSTAVPDASIRSLSDIISPIRN